MPLTSAADSTIWERWWGFNKDPYLALKSVIHTGRMVPGSEELFLGHSDPESVRNSLAPSLGEIHERVVPALRAALSDERDNDVITGVLVALAKIGNAPNVEEGAGLAPLLSSYLPHASQEVSETAAVSLGILADVSALQPLGHLLADSKAGRELVGRSSGVPTRTRAFAAYGLGLIGHRSEDPAVRVRIVDQLLARLASEVGKSTPDVAIACLSAVGLVPLPIDARTELERELDPIHDTRQRQLRSILSIATDSRREDLVRAHAPTTLVRLLEGVDEAEGSKERIALHLLHRLDRVSVAGFEERASCLLALGAIADADDDALDQRIRRRLTEMVDRSAHAQSKSFAMISLARIAARGGRGDEPFAGTEDIEDLLVDQLEKGNARLRPWAALGLGVLGRDRREAGLEVSGSLNDLLRSELESARSPENVGAYAVAIGLRQDPDAQGILNEQLDRIRDDVARGYVALGMGLLGDARAKKPILEILKKSKYRPELLRQAAISLGLLGDKDVASELEGMLSEATSLSAQAAIASALGSIGDARSIDSLLALLANEDVTARARAFAAVALGIVADKEPLPWNAKIASGINYRANPATLTDGTGRGILDIL